MKHTDGAFTEGPVWRIILRQAVPLMLAQLVQLLYNVVDRIYLGHLDGGDSIALTGVGLTFPVITFLVAFAALFGMGGVPLFSIASGAGRQDEAGQILGVSCWLLGVSACVLTAAGYLLCTPILYLLGASAASYPYAAAYLHVYLAGTVFSMLGVGLNGYISAQGYPRIGMLTTVIGAVLNILLDPLFLFVLHLGIAGAALATVLSQAVSAVWVVVFLTGRETPVPLRREHVRFDPAIAGRICKLGTSNFVMQGTACFVQAACNATLQQFGGDVYVGIMTVLNSVRDVIGLPIGGLVSGSQPVLGFNYGAGRRGRVRAAIRFDTLAGAVYTTAAWLLIVLFPAFWFRIFSDDPSLTDGGIGAIRIYFFGFVFMSFQFAAQSTFQALGKAKQAIFFSLLRKAIIVIPLTLLLPRLGMGVTGVFLAEPISNAIGGLASFTTMYLTIYRPLARETGGK